MKLNWEIFSLIFPISYLQSHKKADTKLLLHDMHACVYLTRQEPKVVLGRVIFL